MVGLIAHEWIAQHGGSENVAEAMARTFPDADILTLWNDAPERFQGHRIQESWLARSPLRRSKALALPFMSQAWSKAKTEQYDFVLASSHVFAHHVGDDRESRKFAYIHTPARTIWAPEQDSRGANPLVRHLAPSIRRLDLRHVGSEVSYAANSRFIQRRISEVWHRDSTVIYPPIDVTAVRRGGELGDAEQHVLDDLPEYFVLGASRFVPYKRLDLVVRAGAAAGLPVVLAGGGPLRSQLERMASESSVAVSFVHQPSDALLRQLYRRASVFLFPAVEDFGIMPVEAMAAGTPAMVYRVGGASESVELVRGGVVVDSTDPLVMAQAVKQAMEVDMRGVPARVEAEFGEATFQRRLLDWMSL